MATASTRVVFSRWQREFRPLKRGGTSGSEIFPTQRSTAGWEESCGPKQAHPNPSLHQTPPPSPWQSVHTYPGWGVYSSELSATAQAAQILTGRENLAPMVIQDTEVRLLLLISLWWHFSSSHCTDGSPGAAGEGSQVGSEEPKQCRHHHSGVPTKAWGQGGHGWAWAGTELSAPSLPQISTQTNVSCSNKPVEGIN